MPGGDWGAWELIGDSCTGETDTEENVEAVVDVGEEDKEAEDNENEIDNSSKKAYSNISNLVTEKLSGLSDVKETKGKHGFKSF